MENTVCKVLVVDDHPVLRNGVTMLINEEPDMEVCGEAVSGGEALQYLEKECPDIVLLDMALGDMNGFELIPKMLELHPDLKILVLSTYDEPHYAERSIQLGVKGYVAKKDDADSILTGIRTVLEDNFYLSEKMVPEVLSRITGHSKGDAKSPLEVLSNREIEVFQMIGEGMQTRQIAEKLGLSPKTVQVHREHIKKKLGLGNAVELHQTAFHWVREKAGL